MLKCMSTLLLGPCEVVGGDSDTETTTEVNINVKTGKIIIMRLLLSKLLDNRYKVVMEYI